MSAARFSSRRSFYVLDAQSGADVATAPRRVAGLAAVPAPIFQSGEQSRKRMTIDIGLLWRSPVRSSPRIPVQEWPDGRFGELTPCTSPEGEQLALIPTPESPTNVTFGRGPTSKTLYITAGKSLYRIEINREGYHAAKW
jgi:hypothetical protein